MQSTSVPAPERYVYTRSQAAEFFGVSVRTIDLWTAEGKLTAKRFGRNVRYLRDELMRVANEGISN